MKPGRFTRRRLADAVRPVLGFRQSERLVDGMIPVVMLQLGPHTPSC